MKLLPRKIASVLGLAPAKERESALPVPPTAPSALGSVMFEESLLPPALDLKEPELVRGYESLQRGEVPAAMILLRGLKSRRQPLPFVDYLRALCYLRDKRPYEAVQALREELRYFPEEGPAQDLLTKLLAKLPSPPVPEDAEFRELFTAVQPYTMLSTQRLFSLYSLALAICREDLPGNLVECGVAAGGSAALLAAVVARHTRRPRRLFACDTFSGMPDPGPLDCHSGAGAEATGWGAGTCAAPVESLHRVCAELRVTELVEPVPGLFSDTLPVNRQRFGEIALLHLDGDWYDSTLTIFEQLYDQVIPGGRLQIDDYGYWEGCRRAVEDFQKQRGLVFDLNRIDETGVWMLNSLEKSTSEAV